MKSFRENKLRDEFIAKLSAFQNNKHIGGIDIKALWRWVRDLVKLNNSQSFKHNEVG